MTTRDNLPENNKHFGQSGKMLQQATLINVQNILNDEPKTLRCVRAERLQRLCFHELAGREKQWENDEGGWDERWMGGGAKGEPWLIKWLCFTKPWPPPCFLPPTILSRWDPSHKASIVLLACHSPTSKPVTKWGTLQSGCLTLTPPGLSHQSIHTIFQASTQQSVWGWRQANSKNLSSC